MADWKQKCCAEWQLSAAGVPVPDTVDWKTVYALKPLERNLLRNPAPQGLSHDTPPPEKELTEVPPSVPPQFEPEGDFTGWTTNLEVLPYDTSGIPPGVVICQLPRFSWFTLEQKVDLKAEGLWDDLLDQYQPDIVVEDWYEESQLHNSIYQLRVKLLGADGQKVIQEYTVSPQEDLSIYSHTWKKVSHVFSSYGSGVRFVHFMHTVKNSFMVEFHPTHITDSSVIVKVGKSSGK